MSKKWVLGVILAVVTLLGGGATVYGYFFMLPEKQEELESARKAFQEADAKVKKIAGIKQEIQKLESGLKDKEAKVPNLDRTEYDAFANMLERHRRRAGVFVERGSWATPQRGPQAKPYPATFHKVQYQLSVRGGFYQLVRFINLLEAAETRYVNVESYSISPGTAADAGKKAAAQVREMTITLTSYTYKVPESPLEVKPEERKPVLTTEIPD